jgi:S-adenosylmethionine:tRNA ribosyltransferase-isomerase
MASMDMQPRNDRGDRGEAGPGLLVSAFDYALPRELVAQYPPQRRDESRLLVLDRLASSIQHKRFPDLLELLHPGDVLVLNETKVLPARLLGQRADTGGKAEVLLIREKKPGVWLAAIFGKGNLQRGVVITFRDGRWSGELVKSKGEGVWVLAFRGPEVTPEETMDALLQSEGKMPLPPYIRRPVEHFDEQRYQTVYARLPGAIAAPTAGLHFTERILSELGRKGVRIAKLVLHVGRGTFLPVRAGTVGEHRMEGEYFEVPQETASEVDLAKKEKRRVVAVGTTVVRALETVWGSHDGKPDSANDLKGWTEKFIYPGYEFRAVDALVTNFHLPKTTLLLLVSAFAGRELILKAYQEAIEQKYRFYSYGDAMLIH